MKLNEANLDSVKTEYSKATGEATEYKKLFKEKNRIYFLLGTAFWWGLYLYLYLKEKEIFWSIVRFETNIALLALFVGLFFMPVIVYNLMAYKLFLYLKNPEKLMMQKMASDNNGTFVSGGLNIDNEKGMIFHEGSSRYASDVITFKDGENPVRFFKYSIIRGSGKNATTYCYHILIFQTSTSFPHMYLNYKENSYSMSIGEHLSLPLEFEKYFSLSIPKGYHLEALQIFTPDIMARIIDLPFKSDIEFVNNQIIFVLEDVENLFSNFSRFQWQIIGIKHLINLIKPKIEKASWSKVGDMPYVMK